MMACWPLQLWFRSNNWGLLKIAAVASFTSEIEEIFLKLKEDRRTELKALLFSMESMSSLLIWWTVIDRWFVQSPAKCFFWKRPSFSKQFPRTTSQMVVCYKPFGTSGYFVNWRNSLKTYMRPHMKNPLWCHFTIKSWNGLIRSITLVGYSLIFVGFIQYQISM